jgi:glutamine amidotransferase
MRCTEVVVIDYGTGNLLSVQRGLEHCGVKAILTADPELILNATHVVLPGVGAFGHAMQALQQLELTTIIRQLADKNIYLLGICLGMQLLLDESEEFGLTRGLGLIPGRVIPVPAKTTEGITQKIPHIGWNELHFSDTTNNWSNSILKETQRGEAAYFVHSFMAMPHDPLHRLSDCYYGKHRIPAVIKRNNISGCQFHPEKSGEVGLRILSQFLAQ